MKRFLSGLILSAFLALAASPAWAGSVTLLGAGKSTAAATGINFQVTATPAGLTSPGTNQWTSVNIGTPAADRVVIVGVTNNANGPVTGVTVGGTPLTLVADTTGGGNSGESLWYGSIPTGSTATIVAPTTLTFPNSISIVVMTINTSTPTPGASQIRARGFNADPQTTAAITVPAGGVGIMFGGGVFSASPTVNWNGGVFDANYQTAANLQLVASHILTAGSQVPSVTGWNFGGFGMVAVPWGP